MERDREGLFQGLHVFSLPKDVDQRFWEELSSFEEMQKMPYITSVERIGMERGIQIGEQRGEQKGKADMLFDLLQDRFGSVPDWVCSKLSEADMDTLKKWSKKIFGAEKIEQIFQ